MKHRAPGHRRISVLKAADEWGGRLLTEMARALARPASMAATSGDGCFSEAPRRLLAIKFWGMGSLLLAQPALARLKEAWPGVRVDLLTLESNRQLAGLLREVDTIHGVRLGPWGALTRDALATVRALRREDYDGAIDFEFFVHASALAALAGGIERRIGFARSRGSKRALLSHAVPFRSDRHTAENFLALVEEVIQVGTRRLPGRPASSSPLPGPPVSSSSWSAEGPSAEGETRGALRPVIRIPNGVWPGEDREFRASLGLPPEGPILAVNVNASALAYERRWPEPHFAVAGRRLLEKFPVTLALIGSAEERPYVERCLRAILGTEGKVPSQVGSTGERVVNVAGRTELLELARLLSLSRALVTSDSGPAHLAAALGRPVAVLFGPESPARYAPLGAAVRVFYGNRFCSPCMTVENAKTVRCPYRQACMWELSPDSVLPALEEFLEPWVIGSARTSG